MGPAADILIEISGRRRAALTGVARGIPTSEAAGALLGRTHPFLAALERSGPAVIAEIKCGSPRLGDLRQRVDVDSLLEDYRQGGAAAISVVVEEEHFFGSYELLERCAEATELPVLAKDFVVDPVQLEWAAEAGAAAVLLIAALHSPADLAALAGCARGLGLVPLIETHDKQDLEILGSTGWEMVGVNNRDLRTFEVDLEHSVAMVEHLPAGALRVAESGLSEPEDLVRLSEAGFDAFLIGESLLLADSPADELCRLIGASDGV
jgi:indole-3-glycerol phosphate synthase